MLFYYVFLIRAILNTVRSQCLQLGQLSHKTHTQRTVSSNNRQDNRPKNVSLYVFQGKQGQPGLLGLPGLPGEPVSNSGSKHQHFMSSFFFSPHGLICHLDISSTLPTESDEIKRDKQINLNRQRQRTSQGNKNIPIFFYTGDQ